MADEPLSLISTCTPGQKQATQSVYEQSLASTLVCDLRDQRTPFSPLLGQKHTLLASEAALHYNHYRSSLDLRREREGGHDAIPIHAPGLRRS
jgi:hypothetical protein